MVSTQSSHRYAYATNVSLELLACGLHAQKATHGAMRPWPGEAARIYCTHRPLIHAILNAMTRFAAPAVYQCSECSVYLLWSRLASFSTHIHTSWSDGAKPMRGLLDMCSITCCPACSIALWNEDLEVLGVLPRAPRRIGWIAKMLATWNGDKDGHLQAIREWDDISSEWKVAAHGRSLEYTDVQRALRDMSAPNSGREMFLRRRVWWATNDHIRLRSDGTRVAGQPVASDADRKANMVRMIELHEATGTGISERAELLRQLGRFDDAILLLKSDAPEVRRSENAAWILRWAKAGDADVKAFT